MAERFPHADATYQVAWKWRSVLDGPIGNLSRLRQSLLFAEISALAYYSDEIARELAADLGFPEVQFFERDGSQAYLLRNFDDCVIVCRGTEPHEWNDIRADVHAVFVLAETAGRVHRGFKREVDDLWPLLEKALSSNSRTLWFAGHSLGGAMATICAGRCRLSHIDSNPQGLFTFGSPRVGNKRYVNYVNLEYTRWVNNNDIVTRVPPAWMGYRHTGTEIYIDAHGRVRKLYGWRRTKDRLRGLWMGLRRWQIDPFSDHAIDQYVASIHAAIEAGAPDPG